MAGDISKKTVLVILLIAMVVSVVGTWTVLDAVSSFNNRMATSTTTGNVGLTISGGAVLATSAQEAGVALKIV